MGYVGSFIKTMIAEKTRNTQSIPTYFMSIPLVCITLRDVLERNVNEIENMQFLHLYVHAWYVYHTNNFHTEIGANSFYMGDHDYIKADYFV